jgi:flagellar biosynthetic protein FliQ
MDPNLAVDWVREALRLALVLGAPMLLAALAVAVIVGLVQTVTQMHEPTVALVPRLAVVGLVVLAALPWMFDGWVTFARGLIESLPGRM